jgi:hypothetical protein
VSRSSGLAQTRRPAPRPSISQSARRPHSRATPEPMFTMPPGGARRSAATARPATRRGRSRGG